MREGRCGEWYEVTKSILYAKNWYVQLSECMMLYKMKLYPWGEVMFICFHGRAYAYNQDTVYLDRIQIYSLDAMRKERKQFPSRTKD